jgi:sialate O-acetylesterase
LLKLMKSLLLLLLVLLSSTRFFAQQIATKVTVTRWPRDRSAAISLTFDGAMGTHLDIAAPILKKHGLNGTFFVSTGLGVWERRKSEWRQLAKDGNELGNHTVHHPCLLPEIEPHSQDYTPEMMKAEIQGAAQQITQLVASERGLTFAYPCGDMSFGPSKDQARNAGLYLRYISDVAFGARGAGAWGAQDPDDLGVLTVPELGPTAGKDLGGLLALAEPAIRGHNWGVYCFHGIGGEYLSVSASDFDELAAYLERHSEIWTAPFGDVLRYIQERMSAVTEIHESGGGSVDVALSWPLADGLAFEAPRIPGPVEPLAVGAHDLRRVPKRRLLAHDVRPLEGVRPDDPHLPAVIRLGADDRDPPIPGPSTCSITDATSRCRVGSPVCCISTETAKPKVYATASGLYSS